MGCTDTHASKIPVHVKVKEIKIKKAYNTVSGAEDDHKAHSPHTSALQAGIMRGVG